VTLHPEYGLPARFGFLQVRPMFVSLARIAIEESELTGGNVIAASESVLGNGIIDSITDVIYLKSDRFETSQTGVIAKELAAINKKQMDGDRDYVLITIGRLGTSDPWLGVPVDWADVSRAKCVVECTIPGVGVDLSQGSHFFHNVIGFGVMYFSIKDSDRFGIDEAWLNGQPAVEETDFVRHVRLESPLLIKVDGRNGRGVISR